MKPYITRQSIHQWQESAYSLAAEKGFHDDDLKGDQLDRNVLIRAFALTIGEISEAIEEVRKGNLEPYYVEGKPEGVGFELADTAIRLFDIARMLEIDLEEYISIKHNYNKTRPPKHGKMF